jgi:Arc/MetJ family transcription regulator
MRTNIELDDSLLKEAFRYSTAKTKRGLLHEALLAFIDSHRRKDLLALRGKIRFSDGYDHKALRERR